MTAATPAHTRRRRRAQPRPPPPRARPRDAGAGRAARRRRRRDRRAGAGRQEPLRNPPRPAGARPHRRPARHRPRRPRHHRAWWSSAPRRSTCSSATPPQLERALQQAGLKTADNALEFSLRHQAFRSATNDDAPERRALIVPDDDAAAARRGAAELRPAARARRRHRHPRVRTTPWPHHPSDQSGGHLRDRRRRPTAATSATGGRPGHARRTTSASSCTLLTTQLKNQNPLDPLDTNQFTQQLVQFAQVEQQLKSNDQLATLVSLQKTAQATAALGFVGQTVAVDGDTAPLANGSATWSLNVPKPAVGDGQHPERDRPDRLHRHLHDERRHAALRLGRQETPTAPQWPDGNYTMSVTAKDASGQPVAVPTEIEASVDSADLTQEPAGAFDRRPGLHARQDQARRAHAERRRIPLRYRISCRLPRAPRTAVILRSFPAAASAQAKMRSKFAGNPVLKFIGGNFYPIVVVRLAKF